jgi:hypothetical protein
MNQAVKPEKEEADHHPYRRPRDAATLILIDRSHAKPKVLVGKRHDKVVFMPGKYVFPGGRVDKSDNGTKTLNGVWQPFADAGLLPDPSSLFLIARAITPPGRVRRFDTRFFIADASAIAHKVEGVVHADAELVELVWVEIGSEPLADAHMMTKNVLRELDKRLATGPLRHDAPIPFFHFYGGKMQMDILPGV